jgi:hypothetical protein
VSGCGWRSPIFIETRRYRYQIVFDSKALSPLKIPITCFAMAASARVSSFQFGGCVHPSSVRSLAGLLSPVGYGRRIDALAMAHGIIKCRTLHVYCLQEKANVDHILVQCVYARQVWSDCLQNVGLHKFKLRSHKSQVASRIGGLLQGATFQKPIDKCGSLELIKRIKEELCL